jgi:hypothetical protein
MPRSPFRFFQSKVGLAIMSACLIGGTSAVIAAKTAPGRQIITLAATNQIAAGSSPNSTSGSATATSGKPTPTSGESVSPTATAVAIPTNTPRPPTPTPQIGQTIHIGGSIRSISTNPNSFSLHRLGVSTTIDVNSSTSYSGIATSFSSLQVGWSAQVTCVVQADRSCLASQVSAFLDT